MVNKWLMKHMAKQDFAAKPAVTKKWLTTLGGAQVANQTQGNTGHQDITAKAAVTKRWLTTFGEAHKWLTEYRATRDFTAKPAVTKKWLTMVGGTKVANQTHGSTGHRSETRGNEKVANHIRWRKRCSSSAGQHRSSQ